MNATENAAQMHVTENVAREVVPLLEQAQLSKLRVTQALERRRDMGVRVSAFRQVRFWMLTAEEAAFPSFAKEGWTRPKESAAKHP